MGLPTSFAEEFLTDWSTWVLDHGLPDLPDEVQIGESVPVARWAGPRFAAVLLTKHFEPLPFERPMEDEVASFDRAIDDPRTRAALRRYRQRCLRAVGLGFVGLGFVGLAVATTVIGASGDGEPTGLGEFIALIGISWGGLGFLVGSLTLLRTVRARWVLGRAPWVERPARYRIACRLPRAWDHPEGSFATGMGPPRCQSWDHLGIPHSRSDTRSTRTRRQPGEGCPWPTGRYRCSRSKRCCGSGCGVRAIGVSTA